MGGTDAGLATEAAKALGVMGQSAQLTVLTATDRRRRERPASACRARKPGGPFAPARRTRWPGQTSCSARLARRSSRLPGPPCCAYQGAPCGPAPLAAVVKAMDDSDTEVRQAAFSSLVSWPKATAVPHLVALARAPDTSNAIVALRDGCLRLAAMEEVPMSERLAAYPQRAGGGAPPGGKAAGHLGAGGDFFARLTRPA